MLDDAHSHDMSETLPEAGVRDTLARLIQQSGEGFASLSRLIGRNPAYIQQYLKRGIPRRLSEQDRRRLARHFGVSEALFGAPVATLSPHAAAPDLISIPWLMPGGGDTALQLPPSLLGALPAARRTWLAAQLAKVPERRDPVAARQITYCGRQIAIAWDEHAPRNR